MRKIKSLAELRQLAKDNPRYDALAVVASRNLGGPARTLAEALQWLEMNADETGDEQGVVDEVNFVRDMVDDEMERIKRGQQ